MSLPLAARAQDDQAERDRGFLVGLIEDNLSGVSRQVTIEGFEGALSSRATIESLTIADATGVWFRAEGLTFDWNRSALFGGRIDVTEMSAEIIEFVRLPVSEPQAPSPEASPFSLPELPVAITIEDIRADRITLGEAILGERIDLSLEGSVSLSGGEGTAAIAARRLDGEGQMTIAIAYSNETRNLAVDLDLQEAANGLVVRALDLAGKPSIALTIEGDGQIGDFSADLRLATGGTERVTGTFGLVTVADADGGDRLDVAVDISGDVAALLPDEYGEFFGDDARLAVQVQRLPDGAINLSDLTVQTQSLSLEGSADIAADGWPNRLALQGRIASADGSPVLLPVPGAPTRVQSVDLNIGFDASAGDTWSGAFTVEDFTRPGLTIPALTLTGGGVIVDRAGDAPGRFTADLDYAARDITLDDAAVAEALGAEISGRISVARDGDGPVELSAFTLDGPGIAVQADGSVSGIGGDLEVSTTLLLNADDLARFGALTGLDGLAGVADLTIVAQYLPLTGGFDLTVSGETRALELGIAPLDPLLAGTGRVALDAERDEAGTRLSNLTVTTDEVDLTASANITSTVSDAAFDLGVRQVGVSLPGLDGPGRITGTAARNALGVTTLQATATLPQTRAEIDATMAAPDPDTSDSGPIIASIDLTAADLAPFAELAGRDLAGAVTADVDGTFTLDYQQLDVTVSARTTDLALGIDRIDPLLAGDGTLDARILRTGPLTLSARDVVLRTDALSLTAEAALDDGAGSATFDAVLTDVALVEPRVTGAARLSGTARRDASGIVTLDVTGTGPGQSTLSADATVAAPADGYAVTGDVQASVGALSAFSDIAGRTLAGALQVSANGTLVPDLSRMDIDFDMTGSNLVAGDVALTGGLRATGSVARAADGSGTLTLDAAGPGDTTIDLAAMLGATADGNPVSGEVKLTSASLAPYSGLAGRTLGGSLDLAASGRGLPDLSQFDVTFDMSGANLRAGDLSLAGRIAAQGQATRAADGSGSLSLDATAPGDATVDLTARLGPMEAMDATDGNTMGPITGDLTLSVGSLAPYAALAGRQLAGAVDLTASGMVMPDLSQLDVMFDLAGTDLVAGGIALTGGITATGTATRDDTGAGRADVRATGPGGLSLMLDAVSAPLDAGGAITGDLTLSADSIAPYSGLAGRRLAGAVSADVTGTVQPDLGAFDVTVAASTTGIDVGIAPVADILSGQGTIAARVTRTAPGELSLRNVRIDYPNLDVTGSLDSTGATGTADFDARLADVGLFTDEISGPVTARGTATRSAAGFWQVSVDATGPDGIRADIAGTVSEGGALNLSIDGSAPLGLANAYIEPRRLRGEAQFSLRVDGQPSLDAVSGTVTVANARLADPILQRAVEDINGTIRLSGGTVDLALTGDVEEGGQLTLNGSIALTGAREADVTITATDVVVRDPNLYSTTADATLQIEGPLAGGGRIGGLIRLGETNIQVPSSRIGALGDLPEVTHIGAGPAVRETLNRAGLTVAGTDIGDDGDIDGEGGGGSGALSLDITIETPSRIFIRGRGLDAELGGQLTLRGTTANVIPTGQFDLIRGRLDILQQRFELDEGSVTLQGDFVPFLRLVATTETGDGIVVSIIVSGPANAPDVTFASTPELPQDEVLARLIFGRDLSEISPIQAVQLAAAVGTLAGRGGGGLIDDFRQGIGLDDLDITTDAEGNPAVRAGKYLTDNIYTDVTVGGATTTIDLNLDLTDDITVTGGASSDGDTSLGIFFERDY